jgi:hypothetical protein
MILFSKKTHYVSKLSCFLLNLGLVIGSIKDSKLKWNEM